jgi:hypothetical protein
MFVYSTDNNSNKLNLLSLQPNELPKMTMIYDFKATKLFQVSRWDDFLLVLDENLHVKRFKYSNR